MSDGCSEHDIPTYTILAHWVFSTKENRKFQKVVTLWLHIFLPYSIAVKEFFDLPVLKTCKSVVPVGPAIYLYATKKAELLGLAKFLLSLFLLDHILLSFYYHAVPKIIKANWLNSVINWRLGLVFWKVENKGC